MMDIVDKLNRAWAELDPGDERRPVIGEAIDEIHRLRSELGDKKDEVFRLQCSHSALYADSKALRADAERWRWLRQAVAEQPLV